MKARRVKEHAWNDARPERVPPDYRSESVLHYNHATMEELNGISGSKIKFRKTARDAAVDYLTNTPPREPDFDEEEHRRRIMSNQHKAEFEGKCIPNELAPGLFPNPKGLLGARQESVQMLDAHTKEVEARQQDYLHGLVRDRKDPMPRPPDYDTEEELPPELTEEGRTAKAWQDARDLVKAMDVRRMISDKIRTRGKPRELFFKLYTGPPLQYPGGGVPCDLLAPGIVTLMQWRHEDLLIHPEPIYHTPEFAQTLHAELMNELHQVAKGDGLVNYTDFIEYYKEHGGKFAEEWIRRPLGPQAGGEGNFGLFHHSK